MKRRILDGDFLDRLDAAALVLKTPMTGFFGGSRKARSYGILLNLQISVSMRLVTISDVLTGTFMRELKSTLLNCSQMKDRCTIVL